MAITTQTKHDRPEAADNRKIATYFGRWQNAKGEPGPWSSAMAFTVVA